MNHTIFCSKAFVEAWCSHFEGDLRPLRIEFDEAGRQREVFAVATVGRTGLWAVQFAPSGFFASPGWSGELPASTIDPMLRQLQARQIRRFEWNVRYDHEPLARQLADRLTDVTRVSTHSLALQSDYERTFAGFNATIRNQVRRARKSGVAVAESTRPEDMAEYYAIHEQRARSKGGYGFMFPQAFLLALVESLEECRFLTATVGDRIVAGALFLRDGNSVFYFHAAHDDRFSKQFPVCAIIDHAIQWAHDVKATHFNLGGSAGIESLEKFKSFWGAETVQSWRFAWRNPLWSKLDDAKRWINKLTLSR